MAVAARNRHPGLRQAELGANHVHDALAVVVQPGDADAEVARVALERGNHVLGEEVEERARALARGNDVIDGGERAVGPRHLPPARAKRVECLRRGDLVNEVQADEELRLAGRQRADGVKVPDLLEQRLTHASVISLYQIRSDDP